MAGPQHYSNAALYVVATPIGNLADLSLRAIHVLSLVDTVACEDTRVSAGLLRHLNLHKPMLAVHAHNEAQGAEAVIARLAEGQRVAFVSDAGTPGVSDPGARLVDRVVSAGHAVVPLPGPSAVSTILSVAGDTHGQGYHFMGFVPASGKAREASITRMLHCRETVVCFEAPHRIADLLKRLADQAGTRRVTLGRELTKQFETLYTAPAAQLPDCLNDHAHTQRGEFVLVLHALRPPSTPEQATAPSATAQALLLDLLPLMPLKQAVDLASRHGGGQRKALYTQALAWRAQPSPLKP